MMRDTDGDGIGDACDETPFPPVIASVEIEKWVKYKAEPESDYRKAIDGANICNNVTFKIVVHNDGNVTNLTSIEVVDTLSCSLGYINGSANIPPTTYENHCPDNQTLTWTFAEPWLEPGEYLNITFDAHVDEYGNDTNYACVEAENETGYTVYDKDMVWVNCTPPNIISFAPPSPVNDTVCTWRMFNVTVNQTVNVSWYLNESLLFTNESVTNANCTLHAEVAGEHNVSAIATNANGTNMQTWIWNSVPAGVFDTGSSANPYPSISGTHEGTITPNVTIEVSKLYTYPCSGTGGHSEHVRIWNDTWAGIEASWTGYRGDGHNVSFPESFTLVANETYNYTIRTGSYPQIHHTPALQTTSGWINCTEFTDANGKIYYDRIPAIRLE